MRRVITILLLLLIPGIALAKEVSVRGYYRKDGTYVQPHTRSSPGSGSSSYSAPVFVAPPAEARTEYRTTARTAARTAAAQTAETEKKEVKRYIPTPRTFGMRIWQDVTGRFKVLAAFRSYGNGIVRLVKQDGQTIDVAFEKLCLEDQSYVKELRYK